MQNGLLSTIYFRLQERRSIVFTRPGYGPTTSNPCSENFGFLEIFNTFGGDQRPVLHVENITKWLTENDEEVSNAVKEALIWFLADTDNPTINPLLWPTNGKTPEAINTDGFQRASGSWAVDASDLYLSSHPEWKDWAEATEEEQQACISTWREFSLLPWQSEENCPEWWVKYNHFTDTLWTTDIQSLWALLDETCGLVRSGGDVGEPRLLSWDELWQLPRYGD
jgi:hypothetical protein